MDPDSSINNGSGCQRPAPEKNFLDRLDRQLLMLLQEKFPLVPEPYAELGRQLGVREEEIINRIGRLKEKGIIRRIGAVFDLRRLGYTSTLCALKVPPEKLKEAAAVVNSYTGVTHNYLREHEYNMWFTLIGPSRQKLEEIMAEIKARTGIEDLLELPAEKFYKIRVNFDLNDGEVENGAGDY
ncbi:MAG: siroheme decarboxylase [Clostridia bacterium]|nr:siroheme decarboxylase [Clostridia bacterium]